jgi:hypothetical protein
MELLTLLNEPLFWIASAIGGLLWSVAGNLITPFFQRHIDRIYDRRNRNKILAILEKRSQVERFFISYDDRNSTKLDVIHGLLRALGVMVLGIAAFLIANIMPFPVQYLFYIAGFFILYLGIGVFDKQNNLLYQVRLAEERERALRKWMEESNVAPSEQDKIENFLVRWDSDKFQIPESEIRANLHAL